MMGLEALSPALAKVAGGLSGISNGLAALKTGISLFSFGPVGIIAGIVCIAVGGATMLMGLNEAVNGATGTNYLREWTGMSEEAYANLNMCLNIASTVCTIAGSAAKYFRGSRCFIAGTLVLCMGVDGKECHKKIEDVEVSDKVWSFDEETGTSDWKPVTRLFRNTTESWCTAYISADGEEKLCKITSTLGHKYYLPENKVNRNPDARLEHASYEGLSDKWVSAEDLKYGDKVLLSDGRYGIVQRVEIKKLDTPETTYNFEVKDFHTYYVGNAGVCVHNMGVDCGGKLPIKDSPDFPDGFERKGYPELDNIKKPGLEAKLQKQFPGDWVKVYDYGSINGIDVEFHYFARHTGNYKFDKYFQFKQVF